MDPRLLTVSLDDKIKPKRDGLGLGENTEYWLYMPTIWPLLLTALAQPPVPPTWEPRPVTEPFKYEQAMKPLKLVVVCSTPTISPELFTLKTAKESPVVP